MTQIGRTNKALSSGETFDREIKMPDHSTEDEPGFTLKAFMTKQNCRNLSIFLVMSVGCCFGYYLMDFFLKYLPGSLYANTAADAISQVCGYILAPILLRNFRPEPSFTISYVVASIAAGGMLLALSGFHWIEHLIAFLVLFCKGSLTLCFFMIYYAPTIYFEPRFLGFVMGMI